MMRPGRCRPARSTRAGRRGGCPARGYGRKRRRTWSSAARGGLRRRTVVLGPGTRMVDEVAWVTITFEAHIIAGVPARRRGDPGGPLGRASPSSRTSTYALDATHPRVRRRGAQLRSVSRREATASPATGEAPRVQSGGRACAQLARPVVRRARGTGHDLGIRAGGAR